MFTAREVFPGIFHITDPMGVSFTLLSGKDRSILFDTGYGLENVRAYVNTLAGHPVTILLSHGHHDHVLGSRWFENVLIHEADREEYAMRTGTEQRRKVADQAKNKGIAVPDDFLTACCPVPEKLELPDAFNGFRILRTDLGGMILNVLHVPGHTPGSLMIYVHEYSLLLTGDNWNPCTWLWFPTSVPVRQWRKNMTAVCESLPFTSVLCPHQPMLRDGQEIRDYISSLSDQRLSQAEPVRMDPQIKTRQVKPDGPDALFVFDWDKWIGNRD